MSKQKTMGATDLGFDGLFAFQAPPQGGKQGPPGATPQISHAAPKRSLTNELTEEALTEVDRIAAFSTQLDALLASIEEETTRTVAIHLFLHLTRNDHDYSVDICELSAETGLSRRVVKRALYALTFTGKIQRLRGKQPRRYRLIKGA